MNDNDIIKALERYADNERKNASCDGCSLEKYFPYCNRECSEDTLYVMWLDLINRQKAEIERLTINMNAFGLGMKREKERADTARDEAIKEFAERLKESISNMEYTANIKRKTVSVETLYTQVNWVFHEIVPKTIDKLVKEMTEGEDGNV